ncbi:phage tail fiber protein [Serratia sp. IR-2025]
MKEIISPVDTEDGLFHDGDPSTGTEGTVVSAKWLNPVQTAIIGNQQELASVLKEAGIKIDPSKQDQLLAAIKKITGTATEGFLKVGDYGLGSGPKHKADAYNNVGEIYRVNTASKNNPTNGVAGVISLPCDGGPSTAYVAVNSSGAAWVGSSNTPENGIKWFRVYTSVNRPTPAELNVYSKSESDGRFAFKSITVNGKPLSSNVNLTAGDVNAWNKTEADGRFISKAGDTINGTLKNSKEFQSTGIDNFRMANSDIGSFWRNDGNRLYLLLTNKGDPSGTFNDLRPFTVDLVSGTPSFGSGIHIDGQWPAITTSTGTTWHPDGNVQGAQWGGYLSNWLNSNISNAQNGAQNWAYQNLVQNVRLSGRINQPDTGGQVRVPDGCVFTGVSGANYDPSIWASYSYIQVLINGTWRNIGTS